MKVLIACEESQVVCKAFREKGFEAYSCDIQYCSGDRPDWHIMQDVIPLLNGIKPLANKSLKDTSDCTASRNFLCFVYCEKSQECINSLK